MLSAYWHMSEVIPSSQSSLPQSLVQRNFLSWMDQSDGQPAFTFSPLHPCTYPGAIKPVFLLRSLLWLLIAFRTKALILAKESLNSWPQPPLSLPSTSTNHTPLNALHFHTNITPLPGGRGTFCSSITVSGKRKKKRKKKTSIPQVPAEPPSSFSLS